MDRRVEGKVAVLFGAGSVGPGWGNGKATAVLYARHGATVVCVDVNPATGPKRLLLRLRIVRVGDGEFPAQDEMSCKPGMGVWAVIGVSISAR